MSNTKSEAFIYFDERFTRHEKGVVRNIVAIASELNGFPKTNSTLRDFR